MKKYIFAIGVAFVLGAIGGLFSAFTSASAAASGAETIHLTEQTAQTAFIGQDPQNPRQGDRVIYINDLLSNGKKVGHSAGYCEFVAVAPLDPEVLCLTTLVLSDGQLATSSLFTAKDEAAHKPIAYAIIGGTGKFLNARGEVTRIQLTDPKQALLTISLKWSL